jgi:hypothetical protein
MWDNNSLIWHYNRVQKAEGSESLLLLSWCLDSTAIPSESPLCFLFLSLCVAFLGCFDTHAHSGLQLRHNSNSNKQFRWHSRGHNSKGHTLIDKAMVRLSTNGRRPALPPTVQAHKKLIHIRAHADKKTTSHGSIQEGQNTNSGE